MKLILCDRNPALVKAWQIVFAGLADVETMYGDILDLRGDAIVSPANSFGFMDGGIDAAYTGLFGQAVQQRLQEAIRRFFEGELLVGQAAVVETCYPTIPFLISAPTMRVPMQLHDPINIFLATRAALRLALAKGFERVLMPGMGTGAGRVHPALAAWKMRQAYEDAPGVTFPTSWKDALARHFG